jgi:hypothetical protein
MSMRILAMQTMNVLQSDGMGWTLQEASTVNVDLTPALCHFIAPPPLSANFG